MARRGFFAELHYQAQQAEKQRQRQNAAAARAQAAAVREAERTQRAYERAAAAAERASTAQKKEAEKLAARLHLEARQAEVEELNAALAAQYDEIDSILTATLAVDDYVDLAALKVGKVDHPPFDARGFDKPAPPAPKQTVPTRPTYSDPPAPKTWFGAAKKHAQAISDARAAYEKAHAEWEERLSQIEATHAQAAARRDEREKERIEKLAELRSAYDTACAHREAKAGERNQRLDELINGLAFDVESAINEYVGIVLANSVYPECFPVETDYEFSIDTRELTMTVTVPAPDAVPTVKAYKYVRSSDEITSTNLTQKDQKDRYANAVWQVAVRTMHEIFEADRAGKIHSIALTVGTDTINAATGQPTTIPFVLAAADRETFNSFDLANVVPKATLEHLGAALSKQPFDLVPANTSRGVRARAQD